ncbi:MAG: PilN domain-containing protein [Pleurocapsa sp.]
MYSLDINFLKDRGLDQTAETAVQQQKSQSPVAEKIPIALGAIALVLFPAFAFGYLKSLETQTAAIEKDIQQMEGEISSLGSQNTKLEEIQQQINQVKAETKGLVGVFEKIRPWAAILQEVSDRTPPGIQVDSIQQSGSDNTIGINLAGIARSYEDINDFVLFLERSPFFDSQKIVLNGASLSDLRVAIANEDQVPENFSLEVPQGVKYTISAQLNNQPTSKLIEEIERKGSVGVVTRLKTLETQGAIVK